MNDVFLAPAFLKEQKTADNLLNARILVTAMDVAVSGIGYTVEKAVINGTLRVRLESKAE